MGRGQDGAGRRPKQAARVRTDSADSAHIQRPMVVIALLPLRGCFLFFGKSLLRRSVFLEASLVQVEDSLCVRGGAGVVRYQQDSTP